MPRWLTHPADFPEVALTTRDRVADVGCGLGGTTLAAARTGAEVVALDVEPLALAHTRQRLADAGLEARCRLEHSDCAPIPLPDAWATVVVCTEVLEHVDDPVLFIDQLARIGAPRARYLISVPDPFSERLMTAVAPDTYFKWPGHLRVYKHATLDRLLNEAGLHVAARPTYPHGFYWSLYWTIGWASGAREFGPGCHVPPPPILNDWSELYMRLQAEPRAQPWIAALDQVAPKTQTVFAIKSTASHPAPAIRRRVDPPVDLAPQRTFTQTFEDGLSQTLPELVEAWRSIHGRFADMPTGPAALQILDTTQWPKPTRPGPGARASAHWHALRNHLRDGSLRLGGYDLNWTIRRTRESV